MQRVWKPCALAVALLSLAGAAMAQGRGGGFGGFGFGGPGFGGGGGAMMLLRLPEVQTELKLDEAQKDLLQALGEEMRGKMQALFQESQGAPPQERFQKMNAIRQEGDKKVAEILDPKQRTRLRQLELQQAGLRALAMPDVQETLKLTPEQRQKVGEALRGEGEAMRAAFSGFQFQPGQPPSPEQMEEMRKKMTEVRTATDGKLGAILTPQQKTQWTNMQGPKFNFPPPRPPRGFGGGFGGA